MVTRIKSFLTMLAIVVGVGTSASAGQAADTVYQRDGAAIGGYDPVAYFTDGKPIAGSDAHIYQWQGATWRFASAESKAKFASAPEKYAPKYGGFCAWAVSQGYTAKTDPDAWSIVDGALYLNYSTAVRERWSADKPGNIAKSDKNWPGIKAKLAH